MTSTAAARAAAGLVLLVGLLAGAPAAGSVSAPPGQLPAAGAVPHPAAQPAPAPGPDPAPDDLPPAGPAGPPVGLSPEVAAVPATSPGLDRAEDRRDDVARRLRRDSDDLVATTDELAAATAERDGTAGLLLRRSGQAAKATARAEVLRTDLRALATEWFVTGFGAEAALDPTLGGEELADLSQRRVLAESAAEDTLDDASFVAGRAARLADEVEALRARGVQLSARTDQLAGERGRLEGAVARGGVELAAAEARVAEERLNAQVEGTDLSTVALDAYWRAAARLAAESPRCGVRWWQLAGIGRTESRHGTYRGSRVGVDGRVTQPILGPRLDGSGPFAVVGDSDGGALDGAADTDRAVGPMQFLPSSWRAVGRDATGDGRADPQNLYDAALSAGVYLCRSAPLADDAAVRRAYLTYNRSVVYVDTVAGHAEGYRSAVPLA